MLIMGSNSRSSGKSIAVEKSVLIKSSISHFSIISTQKPSCLLGREDTQEAPLGVELIHIVFMIGAH